MELHKNNIHDSKIIEFNKFVDLRGDFVKTFNCEIFSDFGLNIDWREEYFTKSSLNVIRGMHFQVPPYHHDKIVFCITGKVLDVIVDLRKSSPSYGEVFSMDLCGDDQIAIYVPAGCAHGFVSRSEQSLMFYKVSTVHSPEHDKGIKWDSFDFDWGTASPIVSTRDNLHPNLIDFESPF